MNENMRNGKSDEKDSDMDSPVDEEYIESASQAVSNLIPEDFKPMSGLKIPTSAPDGEMVKFILTGTANGGMVQDIYGAECGYEDSHDGSKQKSKGRIKGMLMGGNKEEE
jgi:hypothetical protein